MVKAYLVADVLTYLVESRLDQMTVMVDLIVSMLDLIDPLEDLAVVREDLVIDIVIKDQVVLVDMVVGMEVVTGILQHKKSLIKHLDYRCKSFPSQRYSYCREESSTSPSNKIDS